MVWQVDSRTNNGKPQANPAGDQEEPGFRLDGLGWDKTDRNCRVSQVEQNAMGQVWECFDQYRRDDFAIDEQNRSGGPPCQALIMRDRNDGFALRDQFLQKLKN